jgi:mannose-6-phosphate isomerase-like protein (cupin superfamily)
MKPIDGYFLIKPEDHTWKLANPMKVPYADLLERSKSEILGARLWRLPPKSTNTFHKHVKAEEFYFVLEGDGSTRRAAVNSR